jgi:hypothetical protein
MNKAIVQPGVFPARLYALQNGCISRVVDLSRGLSETIGPKPLKKHILPGSGDIDIGAVGHYQIAAFAFYIPGDLIDVDEIGVVNAYERMVAQQFFDVLHCAAS